MTSDNGSWIKTKSPGKCLPVRRDFAQTLHPQIANGKQGQRCLSMQRKAIEEQRELCIRAFFLSHASLLLKAGTDYTD